MATSFPDTSVNNPATGAPWADGDTFTPATGVTYIYNDDGTNPPYWSVEGTGGGGGGTPNLQAVTDEGNTTTNEIVVNGLDIGGAPGSGVNNTRCGPSALNALNGGSQNTAVGSAALVTNETGNDNTAVGRNSLFSSTGSSNAGFGANALGNVTGDRNVGIGHNSGSALTDGDNNTVIGSLAGTAGMADTMLFGAGTNERFRVDDSGRMLVGTQTTPVPNGRIVSTSGAFGLGVFSGYTNRGDANGSELYLNKSRGSLASPNTVADNDNLGNIEFRGWDGANYRVAARMQSDVDGSPSAGVMPGRLEFWTTADGAGSPTERMRIGSNGDVSITGGNLVFAKGKGIDFSANDSTTAAGATMVSETLTHYEYGTWTPFFLYLDGTTGDVPFVYNGATGGVYTRIGNRVWIQGYLSWSTAGSTSTTGNFAGYLIGGLPYASSKGSTDYKDQSAVSVGWMRNVELSAAGFFPAFYLPGYFSNTINLYQSNGISGEAISSGDIKDNGSFSFSGCYIVA